MIVLGIESSCDETGAALVDEHGRVIADIVASQVKMHAPYGGVVPELASRAHVQAIVPVVERAAAALPGGLAGVDAVAVTAGPGLVGALLVGVQVAKSIAWALGKPLVGVNHLDGHLLAVFLRREGETHRGPDLPFVALLVSGGHSALYRVESKAEAVLLGQTRDDAAGEAYDKVAKLLGLGYPGGPIVDRLAAEGDPHAVDLPIPMLGHDHLDFSFSGLKTAVARKVATSGKLDDAIVANVCASFQRAIVEALVRKSVTACEREGVRDLVLTGGVAANRGLRARAAKVCEEAGLVLHVPPFASCTDNAAMIAYAGAQRLAAGHDDGLAIAVYSRDPARARGRFAPDGSVRAPR